MKICKDAQVELNTAAAEAEDLEQINRFTRRKFQPEELFLFRVALCDNEIDRDWERFDEKALERLGELFLGKTGICDHSPKAANQQARIYAAEVSEKPGQVTSQGQPYRVLEAKAYMVRTESNRDLILEIEGGIKKEVSVGCSMERAVCSICGQDRKSHPCGHLLGQEYQGKVCHTVLMEPCDAYEWSFVAVPAQKNAGVLKQFGGGREESGEALYSKLEKGTELLLSPGQAMDLGRRLKQLEADCGEYRRQVRKQVAGAAGRLGMPDSETAELFYQALDRLSIAEMKALERLFEQQSEGRERELEPLLITGVASLAGRGEEEFLI